MTKYFKTVILLKLMFPILKDMFIVLLEQIIPESE